MIGSSHVTRHLSCDKVFSRDRMFSHDKLPYHTIGCSPYYMISDRNRPVTATDSGESGEIFEMRKKKFAKQKEGHSVFRFVHNDCPQPPSESPRYPGKNDQL